MLEPEGTTAELPNEKTPDATSHALGNPDSHGSCEQQPQETSTSLTKYPRILSPRTWLYEIASLVAAFAVFVGLIGLLAHYNHKPDPLWGGGFTLNTAVSISSTVFRIVLMYPVAACISQLLWIWISARERPLGHTILFDQATRGVWGSLRILFSSASGSIVSLGAIITIISLALGPFFQQTLTFYNQHTADNSSQALTSSAFSYSGIMRTVDDEPGTELPLNMKDAILTGLISSRLQSPPQPPFVCPSGNCTWDLFSTLAVGTRCYDTSAEFSITCRPWNGSDSHRDFNLEDVPHNCTIPRKNATLAHSLGLRELIDGLFPSEDKTIVFALQTRSLSADQLSPALWNPVPSGGILIIEWLRANDLSGAYILPNTPFEAATCFLYPVVREITTSVTGGIYSENVTREILTPEITNSTGKTSFTFRNTASGDLSIDTYARGVLFQGTQMAMQGEDDFGDFTSIGIYGAGILFAGGADKRVETIPKVLYQSLNITESIYNMAHYMTILMRSNDTILQKQNNRNLNTTTDRSEYIAPSHRVSGTVWVNTIHVNVRWAWLALPAVVLILTSMLLVVTIWESYHRRVGIWKDSSLALLLNTDWNSSAGGIQHVYSGAMTADGIEQDAKSLRVSLVSNQAVDRQVDGDLKKRLLISA